MINKEYCIQRLQDLPGEIRDADKTVLTAMNNVLDAKDALTSKEKELVESDVINGSNAEKRKAQIESLTVEERDILVAVENEQRQKQVELTFLQNEFKAYRAIAGLLAGKEGDYGRYGC